MEITDLKKLKDLSFDDYRLRANDESLSKYQKIGFPDSYREGKEHFIFLDIINKLGVNTSERNSTFLDLGPGCSDVPGMLIEFCIKQQYRLLLADSSEMLEKLPEHDSIKKYPGYFPDDSLLLVSEYKNCIDYIICYSVIHSIFYHTCVFKFLDSAVSLLKAGGRMLIGDIPNISKRTRFFSTPAGVKFHQEYTRSESLPDVYPFTLEPSNIDDSVIMSIISRYRNFGFETYLLPQNTSLPMYNRREDILICKT